MKPEVVVDARADLGEGPAWNDESQSLFWVDIEAGRLHEYRPDGEMDRVWEIGCKVGAAVPGGPRQMVLATERGFEHLDLETETRTLWVEPPGEPPTNRFNDGKCDPQGRFWAGTMSMVHEPQAANFYVLERDRTIRRVLSNVTTSNGLGWSPDQKTMYYIDTPTLMVRAFDFDGENGTISNGRVAVEFPDDAGRPDGMTVDADGMLWVAHWDGGQLSRWNPNTHKQLERVKMPADRVTSCAFRWSGPQNTVHHHRAPRSGRRASIATASRWQPVRHRAIDWRIAHLSVRWRVNTIARRSFEDGRAAAGALKGDSRTHSAASRCDLKHRGTHRDRGAE